MFLVTVGSVATLEYQVTAVTAPQVTLVLVVILEVLGTVVSQATLVFQVTAGFLGIQVTLEGLAIVVHKVILGSLVIVALA